MDLPDTMNVPVVLRLLDQLDAVAGALDAGPPDLARTVDVTLDRIELRQVVDALRFVVALADDDE